MSSTERTENFPQIFDYHNGVNDYPVEFSYCKVRNVETYAQI